jgi:hypothetical protein
VNGTTILILPEKLCALVARQQTPNQPAPLHRVPEPGPPFALQPKRRAAAQSQFSRIALILTGFFRLRNDTGGDKFGFLLLSAGCRFILRANMTPLDSAPSLVA